ncbi:MAG: hypothetical protein RLZZ605_1096 [Bacteroidota bacterium]
MIIKQKPIIKNIVRYSWLDFFSCPRLRIFFLICLLICTNNLRSQERLWSEDYSDLISSKGAANPTKEERKYFTEELDRFKKHWLRKDFNFQSDLLWLNDKEIAFSTLSYPGWEGSDKDAPRIISLNIDTGEFKDSGYRGELVCLNHKRDLMVRFNPLPEKSLPFEGGEWLVGQWGEKLTQVERKTEHYIPNYLCKFHPKVNAYKIINSNTAPLEMSRIVPLLPEHGNLYEVGLTLQGTPKKDTVTLSKLVMPDNTKVDLLIGSVSKEYFNYQAWEESYFDTRIAYQSSITLYPNGTVIYNKPPKLISFWQREKVATYAAYSTRLGILWAPNNIESAWQKYGIYLETENKLIKIEEGRVGPNSVTSPNGCRFLAYIRRGDQRAKFFVARSGYMVIDLCK